jgi:hypothetical protein
MPRIELPSFRGSASHLTALGLAQCREFFLPVDCIPRPLSYARALSRGQDQPIVFRRDWLRTVDAMRPEHG